MSVEIINDICGEESTTVLNSGAKKQCVPKPAYALVLARKDFVFNNASDSRTKTAWDSAKANKDIVPLYNIEEINPNNTEEKKYEGRNEDYITDEAVKGVDYNHIIGDCAYEVLKSYKNSEYTKVFRVLSDGTFHAERQSDGKIKGEPLSSYNVGTLIESIPGGKPQNADISLKFKSYKKSTIKPDFDLKKYEGIYDVNLIQVSASSTSIKFKAISGCAGGNTVDSLTLNDFIVKDASGTVVAANSLVPPNDGVYELTGTGFANNFTVELNGVIQQTFVMFEGINSLTVSI